MKIVVLDGFALNPGDLSWDTLAALGELTVYERTMPGEILQRIEGAEAIFTNKTPITRETLSKAKSLSFVGELATGYNNIDVGAAREFGITVCNVPAYSTDSVVQMTFALLLELCMHVGAHSDAVHAGEWSWCSDFCFWKYPLSELAGKTMGIIGCGRIGKAVARVASAFGMKVIGCSRHAVTDPAISEVSFKELLSVADVVSLHCPLTNENKGMMNADVLQSMKEGAILLNTARGALVDEQALVDALRSGKLSGAGIDVAVQEPIPADSPLLNAPNCIITPHIAWAPLEARQRLMQITVENLRAFQQKKPQNVVN